MCQPLLWSNIATHFSSDHKKETSHSSYCFEYHSLKVETVIALMKWQCTISQDFTVDWWGAVHGIKTSYSWHSLSPCFRFCSCCRSAYCVHVQYHSFHRLLNMHQDERDQLTYLIAYCCSLGPFEKVTLPCLKLLFTLTSKVLNWQGILHYFYKATKCNISKLTMWTDSVIGLSWIGSEPNHQNDWQHIFNSPNTKVRST